MKSEFNRVISQMRQLPTFLCLLLFLNTAASAQYGPNVEIVTATQGNAIASCNALISTLNGITGASASDRYLVKLGPGEFDCGSQTLQMKEYVDIEGSGIEVTEVLGQGVSTPLSGAAAALFLGADHAELRKMTLTLVGTAGKSATAIRNFGTSPRIAGMKIELDGADHCIGIDNEGMNEDIAQSLAAGPIASPYLRELEIVVSCDVTNTGIRIAGRANPVIQRDYIKANHASVSNIGIFVAMEGVPTQQSKEARDVIISAYGPSGEDTSTAFGIQFTPGSGDHEEMNTFNLFNSYVHAGNADSVRAISLAGSSDGSPLKPKLNIYKSQLISKQGYGGWVQGATLILHSSVVESGNGGNDAEIFATSENSAVLTKSTIRIGATHLREGTIVKDSASAVHCAFVYDKTFATVSCPS